MANVGSTSAARSKSTLRYGIFVVENGLTTGIETGKEQGGEMKVELNESLGIIPY